jgi:hypothetical protein
MSANPSLVIPIKLDGDQSLLLLQKIHDRLDKLDSGIKRTKGSADSFASALGNAAGAMFTLETAKTVAGAVGTELQRAADYTQNLADNFVKLQKSMQSIAAISGKGNTNQFTLDQAKQAAAANLTPEKFAEFKDAFLSKASNYVGDKPGAKLSGADSDKFSQSMAEYAALHGVSQGEMADFAGGLLAQEKGPTTADAMKTKAGKVFSTLEASSAKVGHLLPGMTRVMAQGFSAEDAAPTLAMMPEIAPEEESTHLLRAISEVRKLNLAGKGGAYGMTKGMTPQQQLEALVGNLSERSAKGEDLNKMLQDVTHEDIAGGTLRGMVEKGGPKGFAQWKGILKSTPDNAVDADIAAGRQTDAGRVMHGEAQESLATAERGAEHAKLVPEQSLARADITRSKYDEDYHPLEYLARGTLGFVRGVAPAKQRENQTMLGNLRKQVSDAGIEDPGADIGSKTGLDALLGTQIEVNKEANRLLKLLVEKKGPLTAPPVGLSGMRQ